MPESKGHKACQEVRDWVEKRENSYWKSQADKMTKRLDFLAGDRYEKDLGEFNKDRRRLQIRGMETQDAIYHVSAKCSERPRSVEARPVDHIDDPAQAETAASIVEWDTGQPWKCFDDYVEGLVIDALSTRLGVVWMDMEPPDDGNPYARRIYRRIDPRNIIWDECYSNPHEPGCDRILEKRRMPVGQIHRTWPGSEWVKPDKEAYSNGTARTGYPVLEVAGRHALHGLNLDDDRATVWLCWYKNDYSKKPPQEPPPLPDGERYMACTSGCGYRTETQDVLGEPLPEMMDQGCPTCGGNMERVDVQARTPEELAYAHGKRLLIIAPFQQLGIEKPIYDDGWPVPTARSFPGVFLTATQQPGSPVGGPCLVDDNWDQQCASDMLLTHAIKQVFSHQIYWNLPSAGITNIAGERWLARDDDFNVMLRDASMGVDLGVEAIKGSGLDPNFNSVFALTQNKLTANLPKSDFGLTENSSKDIAVGTVEVLQQQAETRTEHFNRRKNAALSKFYGVVWDYIRATLTPEEAMRLRIEGIEFVAQGLGGDDLANYDFWIEDSPRFSPADIHKAKAFQAAMQIPPEFLPGWARFTGAADSVVRELQKAHAEAQANAQAQAMQGLMLGGGAGAPGGVTGASGGPPPQDIMSQEAA